MPRQTEIEIQELGIWALWDCDTAAGLYYLELSADSRKLLHYNYLLLTSRDDYKIKGL